MTMRAKILHFQLHNSRHKFTADPASMFGQVVSVLQAAGWEIRLQGETEALNDSGYHMVYSKPVEIEHCLSLRSCYIPRHFRIEDTNDRWDWQVADKTFTPKGGNRWFMRHWVERLFKDQVITSGGYIFMPLQGKLLQRRHFQTVSPVEMIRRTLKLDPNRSIVATLHPRVIYTAEERQALGTFGPRFILSSEPSISVLAGCDYVVTENSSLALIGYFAQKNAVLFADIDFHHIAANVRKLEENAFQEVLRPQPFDSYLHWFFKENALCEKDADIATKIAERLRKFGWPV